MFPSTRYTLLRSASAATGDRTPALNAVVEIYWHPCYRYVMRRFHASHEAAQDLVQGFFTALLEEQILRRYDAERGPFRPYIRACLDQFVLKDVQRRRAEKRGGGATLISLDGYDLPLAQGETPEEIFQREWQREIFSLATEDLRAHCEDAGHDLRYELFAAYDLAEGARPRYEELAARHRLPVTTITNHLAWARRELRKLLELRLTGVAAGSRERKRELQGLLTTRTE